ncbi:MAG: hypothetical protein A2077_05020 [Nitrospirae bacterium GWC2_46_6]|nr:MAG: hypothetical protein A2Z82_07035 [Nitrospirae bacterium GWA2_46_11]OGW22635.1 MAG: hypothetical protein A2077_05020 [Nitrospirae bacterium GWC2_46_6]OGW23008.1 MAG: hypothetical protein A2X55_12605 [Nitrospirae bacterium GWB2_47_37]HAK88350.1 hypothetical protein [Nitrospiraceae bacterium]HCZ11311.1 hypothetical protein [Nitrospiraceae bacterium]
MAAKTGFAAKEIHHCPLKKHSQEKADADNTPQKAAFQAGQTFVFTVSSAISAMPLSSQEGSGLLPEMAIYKNNFSEPPVKPPRFIIL